MAKDEKKALKDQLRLEITEKNPCEKEISFSLSKDDVALQYDTVLGDVREAGSVHGFRPGKAPKSIVRARYDRPIRQEIVMRIFQSAMERLADEKMQVVSYAEPEKVPEIEDGKDFAFKLTINTAPEFKIPDIGKLDVPLPEIKISDEQVENELLELRSRFADFKKIDSAAAPGDLLKVSYTSTLDKETDFSDAEKYLVSAPESWVWLSEPELIPGINKALEGALPGAKVQFSAAFPENFREKKLAGRNAEYSVEVREIQRKAPLDSDEELCKRTRVDGIAKLREMLREKLKYEEEARSIEQARTKITDALLEAVGEFELPPILLGGQVQNELMSIARRTVRSDAEAEDFKKKMDTHMAEAKTAAAKRLRTFFLMRRIAEAENIMLDDNDIESYLSGASRLYSMKKKELKDRLESSGGIQEVKMSLLVSKVTNHLLEKIKATKAAARP